jgi:hypothetical protein
MTCLTWSALWERTRLKMACLEGTWPAGLRHLQELGQTVEVDHEAEPNLATYDAFISLVDLSNGDGFDI